MNREQQTSPRIVIVAYRPKPGREDELLQLAREHVPLLRREGLATDREAIVGRAKDGTIVEVFEWKAGAIAKAHENAEVGRLWQRYNAACDYIPLNTLPEAADMFAGFEPIEL